MTSNKFDMDVEKAIKLGYMYGMRDNKLDNIQGTESHRIRPPVELIVHIAYHPRELKDLFLTQYKNNGEVKLTSNNIYSCNSLGHVINRHLVRGKAMELCVEFHKQLQVAEMLSQEAYDDLKKEQLSYLRNLQNSTNKPSKKEDTMSNQANIHSLVSETPFVTCLVSINGYGNSMYKIPAEIAKDLNTKDGVIQVVVHILGGGYELGTITELHEDDQINYESSNMVEWIVSVVDDKSYSDLTAKDLEVIKALKQKRKDIAKENLRNIVLESLGTALPSVEKEEKIHD